jgi:hypothetical protein
MKYLQKRARLVGRINVDRRLRVCVLENEGFQLLLLLVSRGDTTSASLESLGPVSALRQPTVELQKGASRASHLLPFKKV